MKTFAKILKGVAVIWCILAGAVIIFGYVNIAIKDGFWELTKMLSPFNITGWIVVFISFAPAIGLYALAKYLKRRTP